MDQHGNVIAKEGCTRCHCGSKYWEKDRCVSCGKHVNQVVETEDTGWTSDHWM